AAKRSRKGHTCHRLLQKQGKSHPGRLRHDRREVWRESSKHDGGYGQASRGRAQNGERCSRERIRNCGRGCRRHACRSPVPKTRPDRPEAARENREGPDARSAKEILDPVPAPADLSRAAHLPGKEAKMRGVCGRTVVPVISAKSPQQEADQGRLW